ncbi:unnamed protein product [Notodromas monacha]|uniref:Uncharacterized protein n=1 Tax=Notodromas monacha TaxID=399045 RepID=A0A7R9BGI3_9CRUS|nr:unnamed protein product [Notodromas monacha]CAG0913980.1 unnamed protein product [Notodromas monacha]
MFSFRFRLPNNAENEEDYDEELVDPLKLENRHSDSSDYSDDEPVTKKPVANRVQVDQSSSESEPEDEDHSAGKARKAVKVPKISTSVSNSEKRRSGDSKRISTVESNVSAKKNAKKSLKSPVGTSKKRENIPAINHSPHDPELQGKRKWTNGVKAERSNGDTPAKLMSPKKKTKKSVLTGADEWEGSAW